MRMLKGLRRAHYACLAADVPWKYVVRSAKGLGRSAEKHYQTMTLDEIAALPVAGLAADDAFLHFWVTGPFFAIGAHMPIMRAWGFEPVAVQHVWLKPVPSKFHQGQFFFDDAILKMGMGHTSRQNAEFVVLGRRGQPRRQSRAVRQVFFEPAREHSRKPEKFYAAVESFCAGPRLELFGRQQRRGWTVRGDEARKFHAA